MRARKTSSPSSYCSNVHSETTEANSGTDISLAHSSLQLTVQKLNGKNYQEWASFIKLPINGRGKLDHLTGEVCKPAADDQSENLEVKELTGDCLAHQLNEASYWETTSLFANSQNVWEELRDFTQTWRTHHKLLI